MRLQNIMIDHRDPYISIMERFYIKTRKDEEKKRLKAHLPKKLKSKIAIENQPLNMHNTDIEGIRPYVSFETGDQKRERLLKNFVLPKHKSL